MVHAPDDLRRVLVVQEVDGTRAVVPVPGPSAQDMGRAVSQVPPGANVVGLELDLSSVAGA